MGSEISTLILLAGTILTGVLSSVAANAARQGNVDKARLWCGISAGTAIFLIVFSIFLLIRSHMGAGSISSVAGLLAPGVSISLILLMLAMVGVSILETMAFISAIDKDTSKSMKQSIGAAALSFIAFVFCLIIIIVLL